MIWLRRLSWCVMWTGLVVAVVNHRDVLVGSDAASVELFVAALIAIAIGLFGIYFTRQPGDSGFGF